MSVKAAISNNDLLVGCYSSSSKSGISEIFKEDINISIWERELSKEIITASEEALRDRPEFELSELVKPDETKDMLIEKMSSSESMFCLYDDISNLVGTFCDLFKFNNAWLRIDAIDKPMCPRFHADYNKCRLLTTYVGPGTQWLPSPIVDRTKLGSGNLGQPDHESGLYLKDSAIQQLQSGDVALIKGEAWGTNQGSGLVHRSPHTKENYKRLYLTIDFSELYSYVYRLTEL